MKKFKFLRDNRKDRFNELVNHNNIQRISNRRRYQYEIRYVENPVYTMDELIEHTKNNMSHQCGYPVNGEWYISIHNDGEDFIIRIELYF